ncbi:hypothetical protein PFISCL1PPCAC_13462, partial [Pristionchus fissidentatus]
YYPIRSARNSAHSDGVSQHGRFRKYSHGDIETSLVMYYIITLHSLVHTILLLATTPAYRRFLAAAATCQFSSDWTQPSKRNASVGWENLRLKLR